MKVKKLTQNGSDSLVTWVCEDVDVSAICHGVSGAGTVLEDFVIVVISVV